MLKRTVTKEHLIWESDCEESWIETLETLCVNPPPGFFSLNLKTRSRSEVRNLFGPLPETYLKHKLVVNIL